MKPLVVLGWVLLVVESLFVASLLIARNAGDDAAGRGLGTIYGLVLGGLLAAAAAAFIWGQRGGPRVAFFLGLGALAVPLVFLVVSLGGRRLGELDRALGRARGVRFADARVNRAAEAVIAGDTSALQARLAEGGLDFTARNGDGRTLLGLAVERATDWGAVPAALASVRVLLEAGVPPAQDALAPARTPAEPDGHLLTTWVFHRSPAAPQVLDLLLQHGGEKNPVDASGQPMLMSTEMTLPFLEVLARHGADLAVLDTTRTDRPAYTGPMTAAVFGNWDQVLFYLDHGLDAAYTAPDGVSLRTLVAEKDKEGVRDAAFLEVKRRLSR